MKLYEQKTGNIGAMSHKAFQAQEPPILVKDSFEEETIVMHVVLQFKL